ncbi:hypothetical protein TorRG33x02_217000 [Trema orientale]|uniref:Uncharacterized protein n=1 Tax=Trema orientale TaxID=63057 RepID=A0A2P5EA73_TREOI|nr:hypothetical protein TorRG33x02_217000 [Trema orientale]
MLEENRRPKTISRIWKPGNPQPAPRPNDHHCQRTSPPCSLPPIDAMLEASLLFEPRGCEKELTKETLPCQIFEDPGRFRPPQISPSTWDESPDLPHRPPIVSR